MNNFAFNEDVVLWPNPTCLDGWVVCGWLDFPKIKPSQPQTKAGVVAGAELGNKRGLSRAKLGPARVEICFALMGWVRIGQQKIYNYPLTWIRVGTEFGCSGQPYVAHVAFMMYTLYFCG